MEVQLNPEGAAAAKREAIANANAQLNNVGLPTYDDLVKALQIATTTLQTVLTAVAKASCAN